MKQSSESYWIFPKTTAFHNTSNNYLYGSWRLWKSRNLLVYQQQQSLWQNDINQALYDAGERALVLEESRNPQGNNQYVTRSPSTTHWKRPQSGFIKCNYDCNLQHNERSRAAWIFRDEDGFYLGAGQSQQHIALSPLEAELQALLMSMQHAWSRGFQRVIFEGDNKTVLDLATRAQQNFGLHNWIRDIKLWQAKFEIGSFQWIPRMGNHTADRLVKENLPSNSDFYYHHFVPSCIVNTLHVDHCH